MLSVSRTLRLHPHRHEHLALFHRLICIASILFTGRFAQALINWAEHTITLQPDAGVEEAVVVFPFTNTGETPITITEVKTIRPANHQTIAAPVSELECLIITDNPTEDVFFYPDSNKWGTRLSGKVFQIREVDYFDGKE